MGYGRSVKLAALLVGTMGVLWSATAVMADDVDANIGGIATFTGADGKAFRVNSEKNLNLERFETWEGDIQVDWTPGVKTSVYTLQGYKVAVGSVNSVGSTAYYHAWGHYAGGQGGTGGGGTPPTWDADYKKGSGLSAHVFGYGNENSVTLGSNGGKLVISLTGGSSGSQTVYMTVTVGSDVVECPATTTIIGPTGVAEVNLTGLKAGEFSIQVNCDGQQAIACAAVFTTGEDPGVKPVLGGNFTEAKANEWSGKAAHPNFPKFKHDDYSHHFVKEQFIAIGGDHYCETIKVGDDRQIVTVGTQP